MQIFKISDRLPGLNEYINACRRNKYAGAKMKKDADNLVCWFISMAHLEPITEPIKLIFEWHIKKDKRDLDNIAFAKKFILDALQETKILPNDNKKYVQGFTDNFFYDKENEIVVGLIPIKEKNEFNGEGKG